MEKPGKSWGNWRIFISRRGNAWRKWKEAQILLLRHWKSSAKR